MRTTSTGSNAASNGPVPMEIGWVNKKGKGKGKGKDKGKKRARTRRKERGRSRVRNMARSLKGGATTAESGATSMPTVGMEKRNRCTKFAGVSVDK